MSAYEIESVQKDGESHTVMMRGRTSSESDVWEHHFPGFPVLPGVLMLDLMKKGAEKWHGKPLRIASIRRVRFSNYLKPGTLWESRTQFSADGARSENFVDCPC